MKLEPRPLYAIGTVARLTGLKPDTLRVWERRYGLGASHRSRTGRRQYTQADLEHMQLVATLINSGVRIGEISACSGKTLEIMVRGPGDTKGEVQERKPRVLVIGPTMCRWLDEHQGCLTHVTANLARVSLAEARDALAGADAPDLLVIGCERLGMAQVRQVEELAAALHAGRTLVAYTSSTQRSLAALARADTGTTAFPPDSGFLAFELARLAAELASRRGSTHLGELVNGRPRQLSSAELAAASAVVPGSDVIDPARLAALVNGLAGLEEDIAAGAVGDWSDAAVQACAYAYAGQARWLMERALQIVMRPE
ncbi:MAG: MerR family transcriptional regulator [Halioglobus sp.]|nr:MerR family transcriptional regulator [Halioglobus sp.]